MPRLTPAQFSELLRAHNHTVVVALLAWGVRLPEARELAHDAWARLWEKIQAGTLVELELPGLAIRQASFLLADRRRLGRELAPVELLQGAVDPLASPLARVSAKQELDRISVLLATLSPRAQQVMHSALESDAGHAELAEQSGISVQRFRQVLWEVRTRLRAALGERAR